MREQTESDPHWPEEYPPTSSIVRVPTVNSRRYLQQLCNHWNRFLEVHSSSNQGMIVYPRVTSRGNWAGEALITIKSESDMLVCLVDATAQGQLEELKRMLVGHIDRFASHEAPLIFEWIDL